MRLEHKRKVFIIIFLPFFFLGLYLASQYNYLLFHYLSEMFSIIVAGSIFIITWNSKNYLKNGFFIIIGISYFFVGGFDLLHTMTFEGMNILSENSGVTVKLWLSARYIESTSILAAFFFLNSKPGRSLYYIKTVYISLSIFLILSIFHWKIFPTSYIEGLGLTPFKKISEYIICFFLLIAMGLLFKFKDRFDHSTFKYLLFSMIFSVAAELAFTLYITSDGLANMIGHFLKIISFYLIYKAIIETGIRTPYKIIFRDMKKNEMMLERLARTDTLTGLLNRRAFIVIFEYERAISSRAGKQNSIIMGDIDHFKLVNDQHGHHVGDYILKTIADIFYNSLRQQDSICRWGGEEFVILLPDVNFQNAGVVAEKLRRNIEQHQFLYNQIQIHITISFGVSPFDPQLTVNENLKRVDSYLYESKEKGRNKVTCGQIPGP